MSDDMEFVLPPETPRIAKARAPHVNYPALSKLYNQKLHGIQDSYQNAPPEFLDTLADWARARATQRKVELMPDGH